MLPTKIPTNEKERMELHLAYKKQMKNIILSFFCENIESISQLKENSTLADLNKIIDQWVESRFEPEPDPRWKSE